MGLGLWVGQLWTWCNLVAGRRLHSTASSEKPGALGLGTTDRAANRRSSSTPVRAAMLAVISSKPSCGAAGPALGYACVMPKSDVLQNFIGGEWVDSSGATTPRRPEPGDRRDARARSRSRPRPTSTPPCAPRSARSPPGARRRPSSARATCSSCKTLLDAARRGDRRDLHRRARQDARRGAERRRARHRERRARVRHPRADDGRDARGRRRRASTASRSASRSASSRRSRRSTSRRWCRSGSSPTRSRAGTRSSLKPSEQVPLSQQRIFELIAGGRPPAGRRQPRQRRRRRSSTRSARTPASRACRSSARRPSRSTSTRPRREHGKRVQALGGAKNFLVVMPDAEMGRSVQNVVRLGYGCAGQRCLAGSIVVARRRRLRAPSRDGLVAAAKAIKLGDGSKPGDDDGPGHLGEAPREGARLHREGRPGGREARCSTAATRSRAGATGRQLDRADDLRRREAGDDDREGGDLRPGRVPHAREGPRRGDRACSNASEYGNAASIFTTSGKHAREFKAKAAPGMIGVNIGVAAPMAFFPFGGTKA